MTVLAAWLETRPRREQESARSLETVSVSAMLVTTVAMLAFGSGSMFSAPARTAVRRLLLDSFPASATVLLPYPYHPITVNDASYWGAILMVDSPGRLCAAVDEYRKEYPASPVKLPRCSLLTDLRERRPDAVYRDLAIVGTPQEYLQTRRLIEAEYDSNDLLAAAPTLTFASYVFFRKRP